MSMIGAEKMADKLNLESLLSSLNSTDISYSINRLHDILNSSDDKENIDGSQPYNKQGGFNSTAHLDPKINLLLALIPLLSAKKQNQANSLLRSGILFTITIL